MPCNCCVIVICGVPGSGKSTLSHALSLSPRTVQVISFDDYEIDRDSWNEESFALSRRAGIERISSALNACHADIIVIDDIMFYRSMRRKIYQLARDHMAGYLTVYIDSTFDVVCARNAERAGASRVTDESMRNIWSKFEPPSDVGWESDNVRISGDMSLDSLHEHVNNIIEKADFACSKAVERQQVLEARLESQSHSANHDNYMHTLDIKLRQIVSAVLQESGFFYTEKGEKKRISKLISSMKSEIVCRARANDGSDMCDVDCSFVRYWLSKFVEYLESVDDLKRIIALSNVQLLLSDIIPPE